MSGSEVRVPVQGIGRVVVECIDSNEDDGHGEGHHGYRKSSLTTMQNSYPVKIMVPSNASNNNCHWIYPIIFGGGLVGGDHVDLSVQVKENCCALLTGQESTKVYHCEPHRDTHQTLHCCVEDGGLLCVLSDPVVCYKDSRFHQRQILRMSRAASLVYLDWMIGGRVALDELWQFTSYENKTDLYIDDRLVYRDIYHLANKAPISVKQAMGPFQVIGSCLVVGQKLEQVSLQLGRLFGRTKLIGEKHQRDGVVCSVSPQRYVVGETAVTGVYIRFLATSSLQAYEHVVCKIVDLLAPAIGGNPFEDKY